MKKSCKRGAPALPRNQEKMKEFVFRLNIINLSMSQLARELPFSMSPFTIRAKLRSDIGISQKEEKAIEKVIRVHEQRIKNSLLGFNK